MKLSILASLVMIVISLSSVDTYSQKKASMNNLYDISINDINGEPINLHNFKGKYILFVNVASKCGFTPQYKELQELHETHKNKLVIIGVPCNQFGSQEPGTHKEIKAFCTKNYGVEFLITEKIEVKGKNIHPLYQWLTMKEFNGVKSSAVKWNFQKYFISKDGKWVDYFFSTTSPSSKKIVALIK